jgi:hypothetical protein
LIHLRRILTVLLTIMSLAANANPKDDISQLLDHFHAAASAAHFDEYFGLFAPDGVFIGTDPGERWTVAQFKAYAKPHFDKGEGWTYKSTQRHIDVAPDGQHAWFDELLDNKWLGVCRGTGALRLIDGQWRVEQYALTIPVPNEAADAVTKLMRSQSK